MADLRKKFEAVHDLEWALSHRGSQVGRTPNPGAVVIVALAEGGIDPTLVAVSPLLEFGWHRMEG